MSLEHLLDNVTEQQEEVGLIIDFDSIIFLSAYKYTDVDDEELVYMDCCKRIYAIERECYERYTLKDTKLALTSSTNFRYDIYPEYKGNRKDKDDKAEKLSQLVKRAKRLIYERLKPILEVNSIAEADDICLDYANNKGYIVAAIDGDVVSQCVTPVFNFHHKHWKFIHEGKETLDIAKNVFIDSIKGKPKDNVKGIKGKGEVFAKKYVEELFDGKHSFNDYVELFDTPSDMLMNFRCCHMGQYNNGKLEMIGVEGIADMLCPF
jgi:hypothetical protein